MSDNMNTEELDYDQDSEYENMEDGYEGDEDHTHSDIGAGSEREDRNQSINQISIAPISPAKPGSVIRTTAESVFNSTIHETVPWHQRAVGCAGV